MSPKPFEFCVDENASGHNEDEPEKHEEHCLEGWLVEHIVACPLVDEIQHFVGSHIAVRVGNSPLELLQVLLLLDLGNEGHLRLGDNEIGDGFEAKLNRKINTVSKIG